VSIARALLGGPRLLLMDEPFGALDEITRDRLNEELRRIWQETGTTILFVTHSVYEAMYLGEEVLVMSANPGRVREIVPIDLPRDRDLAIRETEPFIRIAAKLRNLLGRGAQ
jgi:NitT/TauT family transport system ATP-binding protein